MPLSVSSHCYFCGLGCVPLATLEKSRPTCLECCVRSEGIPPPLSEGLLSLKGQPAGATWLESQAPRDPGADTGEMRTGTAPDVDKVPSAGWSWGFRQAPDEEMLRAPFCSPEASSREGGQRGARTALGANAGACAAPYTGQALVSAFPRRGRSQDRKTAPAQHLGTPQSSR